MQYLFPKLIFHPGALDALPGEASQYGRRALVCHAGSFARNGGLEHLLHSLTQAGIACLPHQVDTSHEPSPRTVDLAVDQAHTFQADCILAVGGGSVLDVGKIAAGVYTNGGLTEEFVENIGTRTFDAQPLPFLAVPTTSGTGSEMTKNGVVCLPGTYKNSVRANCLLARAAIVDPLLTISLPPAATANAGADALCQLIESYTTKNATPFTDGLALAHIASVTQALADAVKDGENLQARTALSIGATVSGLCLANAGLGLAHGISAALGAVAGVPHGIGCGILMPVVAKFNARKGVDKYIHVAAAFGKTYANAVDAGAYVAERLQQLNQVIHLPEHLKDYTLTPEQKRRVVELSTISSSARKNPVPASAEEIAALLEELV